LPVVTLVPTFDGLVTVSFAATLVTRLFTFTLVSRWITTVDALRTLRYGVGYVVGLRVVHALRFFTVAARLPTRYVLVVPRFTPGRYALCTARYAPLRTFVYTVVVRCCVYVLFPLFVGYVVTFTLVGYVYVG